MFCDVNGGTISLSAFPESLTVVSPRGHCFGAIASIKALAVNAHHSGNRFMMI